MYLFLSSDDCLDSHPDNHAWDFTVDLGKYVNLKGEWECALMDLRSPLKGEVYVYSDLCASSFVSGSYASILRIVNNRTTMDPPYYMPVAHDYVGHVRVYIRTEKNEMPSFTNKRLTCTLHLRRVQ